jgi:putative addiction module killer protein
MVTFTLLLAHEYSGRRIRSPGWHHPYRTWFDSLDAQAAAKVVTATLRLELGNSSNVKWFSGIGEYVIDWGPRYRIYLAKDGNTLIVLFGGGTKRRQQGEIDRAVALHTEYKSRKAPKAAANKVDKRKR